MSQYFTIQTIDGNNTDKYQTISTSTTSTQSTTITARRIAVTTGNLTHYVRFGSSPVVTTANGFVIPSNTTMIFNFYSGNKVATIATGASSMSIIDLD